MARLRTPIEKAEVSGATVINAGRYEGRDKVKRKRPIGKPYAGMLPGEIDFWNETIESCYWLHSAHRVLLMQVCRLANRVLSDPECAIANFSTLNAALSKLGMTPTEESKISHDEEKPEDPAAEFFGRRAN